MSKTKQSERDYTMMKQAFMAGMIITAVVFAPIIRGALFGSSSSPMISDRVLRLEVQNGEHARLAEQLISQSGIITGMQEAQAEMFAQVRILAEMVNAMQKREFARLEDRHSGL